jgi:hypothetical protein
VTHVASPIHLYGENSFPVPRVNPAVIGEVRDAYRGEQCGQLGASRNFDLVN